MTADIDKKIKESELKSNDYLSKKIYEVRDLLFYLFIPKTCLEGFHIQPMLFHKEATQDFSLTMGQINGFRFAGKNTADQSGPVRMIGKDETSFISPSTAGTSNLHPS